MAQGSRLTVLSVGRITDPGLYPDGAGLYLQVTKSGEDEQPAKSWLYRYKLNGRERQMGLGSFSEFGLQEARDRAQAARQQRRDGVDPIEARRAARAQAALDAAKAISFADCAKSYISAHGAGWRNAKHAEQWPSTLKKYADPVIGKLAVGSIDTSLVLKLLEPIWTKKPETAGRVRQRIEAVLDWAKVRGYRAGENPARWRGHLDKLLPKRSRVREIEHHAALPYQELPDFIVALQAQHGVSPRALEFAILTCARTGELTGARRGEINFAEKIWIIPATRMKARREHRVPLSARALEILDDVAPSAAGAAAREDRQAFVFQSERDKKPLSNMALLMLLRRMGRDDLTVHGFRSTFRDWAAERTNFPSEAAEMALAHAVGDKVEAAYRRGDLFERRRRMMAAWATFCESPAASSGKVATLRRSR